MDLQPIKRIFTGPYLHINLEQLKAGVKSLAIHRETYFSTPPNTVSWAIITRDGKLTGREEIERAAMVLDRYEAATLQLSLTIFPDEKTPRLGLRLTPKEHVTINLDFMRKTLFFESCIVGEEHAEVLFKLLTCGITLMDIELPAEHQYLEPYLRKFCMDHPSIDRNVFLIMRFQNQHPFPKIVEIIRNTYARYHLTVVRADDKEYTDDLLDNVMTYMYGCKSAIAVFDHINYREFNPSVALEVGFMFALRKRVLLLKDVAIPMMPTDLTGKVYRPFNTYDPEGTIPPQIEKWIIDYVLGT